MERNQLIGLLLIFGLIMGFYYVNQPSDEELTRQREIQDSISMVKQTLPADTIQQNIKQEFTPQVETNQMDSIVSLQQKFLFGDFYNVATGEEQTYSLENDNIRVQFTNLGGRVNEVWVKDHKKIEEGPKHEEIKLDLKLMNNPKAKFEYLLPVRAAKDGIVNTGELFFTAQQSSKSIIFELKSASGAVLRQIYTLSDDAFTVDYQVETDNLHLVVDRNTEELELIWVEFLDKLEKNDNFEKTYATLQYKIYEDDTDYLKYTKDNSEELAGEKLQWLSNSNQFFSSVLMAKNGEYFKAGDVSIKNADENAAYLKECTSQIFIPIDSGSDESNEYTFYFGPNDYDGLKAFDNDLEESINFGRSVFGTVNRYIIRPIFLFFLDWTNSAGIAILLLILLVKTLLYPLTYKMLKSNAKMGSLKPEITQIKDKYKDDSQKSQMKTMELYRKFGVSPFGGCMPMVLQMPIWFALFRFFPAAFEFRQKPFLWATDLSSYDALFHLPFEIPMFGSHLSLFALLWTITTLIYTFYNTQTMDLGNSNPAMKYMQYFMPVIFIVFFNNYASGLTAYMFLSNVINIAQTVITKKFVFDDEKIREQLELKKDKPKKKNSFSKRLENAMKAQQAAAEEQKKKGKNKKK